MKVTIISETGQYFKIYSTCVSWNLGKRFMNGQSWMVEHIILNSCSLNLHCSGEWMNNKENPPQRFSYTSSVCVSLQCQKLSLETFHPYFQVSKDPTQNHNKNVPFTHDDQLHWILNYWWWWQSWRFNLQEWESVWRCDSRLVSLWGASLWCLSGERSGSEKTIWHNSPRITLPI